MGYDYSRFAGVMIADSADRIENMDGGYSLNSCCLDSLVQHHGHRITLQSLLLETQRGLRLNEQICCSRLLDSPIVPIIVLKASVLYSRSHKYFLRLFRVSCAGLAHLLDYLDNL